MKHVVRMLVAILIVGALGGGIWYFVFRDKPNVATFKEMTASIDYVDSVSIKTETETVKGYYNVIDVYLKKASKKYPKAYTTIENLEKYDLYSYETIEYYYSLTATANKVKSKDKKSLVKKIDAYNSSIKTVVNTVKDSVGLYEKEGVSLDTINQMDTILLKNMLKKQKSQTELYFALRDYVEKYVFASVTEDGSGIIPDYKSAIYNIYNNQLNLDCEKLSKKLNSETIEGTWGNLLTKDGSKIDDLYVAIKGTKKDPGDSGYDSEVIKGLEYKNYIVNDGNKNAVKFLDSYTKFYKNSKNKIVEVLKISNWGNFVNAVSQELTKAEEEERKPNYSQISVDYPISEDDTLDAYNVLVYIIKV